MLYFSAPDWILSYKMNAISKFVLLRALNLSRKDPATPRFLTNESLANTFGVTERTIVNAFKELKAEGFIKLCRNPNNPFDNSRFFILTEKALRCDDDNQPIDFSQSENIALSNKQNLHIAGEKIALSQSENIALSSLKNIDKDKENKIERELPVSDHSFDYELDLINEYPELRSMSQTESEYAAMSENDASVNDQDLKSLQSVPETHTAQSSIIHVAKRPSGCTFEQEPDVQNTLAVSGSMPAVNAAGAYEHKERAVSPYPQAFFQTLEWSISAFNQVKRHICTQYPDLYSMTEIELKAMAARFYTAKLESKRIRNGQAAYIEIESWLSQYKKQNYESVNSNRPLDQTTRLNNLARCLSERGEVLSISQDNVVNVDYEVIDEGVTDKHPLICNKVNV